MLTIDASVHINAINPSEQGSATSQAFLSHVHQQGLTVISPTLLVVEIAASAARLYNDDARAFVLSQAVSLQRTYRWIILDMDSSEETAKLAATSRLRGADAVYAAVAQRHKTVLVTRDRQQLERLASVIPTQTPEDFLSSLSTSAPTANE